VRLPANVIPRFLESTNSGIEAIMNTKRIGLTLLVILWATILTLGVNYANPPVRDALAESFPGAPIYIYDIFSDAVWLFVAVIVAAWSPRFFGYQVGDIGKHLKLLLGLFIFVAGAPLVYRLLAGNTPFSANTLFFEVIVVPITEEGFFRGVILSMLLLGLAPLYSPRATQILVVILSSVLFAALHLSNLGTYPTGFILFQVFFSLVFGLLFGYSRVKTNSIYPAIGLHAVLNLVATVG
jgi:membrane protease YdiL (CAAX protease family)